MVTTVLRMLCDSNYPLQVLSGSWGGGQDSVKVWESSSAKLTHVLHSESAHTSVRTLITPLVVVLVVVVVGVVVMVGIVSCVW